MSVKRLIDLYSPEHQGFGLSKKSAPSLSLAKKYVSASWPVHGVFAKFCISSAPPGASRLRAELAG
jgi:hypothetical protein